MQASENSLRERIERLKREKNAVILAHYYTRPEVQAAADFLGDSLALAVKALVMVLGALGLANMWMAVFADVGVAVLAILNSMRTLSLGKTE